MDALRYIPGEPTPCDPVEARAQRGPGSAVAADAEANGAHVIPTPTPIGADVLVARLRRGRLTGKPIIEALESASGDCRLLDTDIVIALRPSWEVADEDDRHPYYTQDIGDAISLVPDGWYWRVEPRFYEGECVRWRAYAIKPDWPKVGTPLQYDDFPHTMAEAATAPLALCAAALKAMVA